MAQEDGLGATFVDNNANNAMPHAPVNNFPPPPTYGMAPPTPINGFQAPPPQQFAMAPPPMPMPLGGYAPPTVQPTQNEQNAQPKEEDEVKSAKPMINDDSDSQKSIELAKTSSSESDSGSGLKRKNAESDHSDDSSSKALIQRKPQSPRYSSASSDSGN